MATGAPDLYWIVGPTYELARPEFEYCASLAQRLGLDVILSEPRAGPGALTLDNGAEIVTKSADDPKRLGAKAPRGILACEAAQMPYSAFLRLIGRTAEKRGWLWASGTFEGSVGWYPEYWKRWRGDNAENARSFSLPTWSNLAVFPGGRDDPEIKSLEASYPPDLFLERFGAVPCPPATLVFREFSFTAHVADEVRFDDQQPVEIAVDPGYAGAYAVLAMQRKGNIIHVIDEVYRRGMVAEEVIAVCKACSWWGKVTSGVMDIAGESHTGVTKEMPSHSKIWQAKTGLYLRSNRVGVQQGIHRLRTFLKDPATGQPRIMFAASLAGGVDGLGHARGILAEFGLYKYRELGEGQPVREEPVDRDNHSIKALSYWLYDRFGPVEQERPKSPILHDRGGFR